MLVSASRAKSQINCVSHLLLALFSVTTGTDCSPGEHDAKESGSVSWYLSLAEGFSWSLWETWSRSGVSLLIVGRGCSLLLGKDTKWLPELCGVLDACA